MIFRNVPLFATTNGHPVTTRGCFGVSGAPDPHIGALIEQLSPSPFQGLLLAAWSHEVNGEARAAAATYRTALQAIPQFLAQSARPILEHARARVMANDADLEAFLEQRLASLRARHGNQPLGRIDRAREILLRKRRVYRPTPSFMYVPQL